MAEYSYLYAVGDLVVCEMLHGLTGSGKCSVVKRMPPLGTQLQYRVKFIDEKFERVVLEGQLSKQDAVA